MKISSSKIFEIDEFKEFFFQRLVHLHRDFCSIELVLSWGGRNLREVMLSYPEQKLPLPLAKHIAIQLFRGVLYLHGSAVLHRDIKPENILVTNEFQVKLTDFGISRTMTLKGRPMTPELQTLYYRAPEVVLGDVNYTNAVDMWSLGCLLYEMLVGRPLFQADSNADLLIKIIRTMGTPDPNTWPNVLNLQGYKALSVERISKFQPMPFDLLMPEIASTEPEALELLKGLLQLNPDLRISAKEALQSSVAISFRSL